MRSKWRFIEENLHVFRTPHQSPKEFEKMSRILGSLLLDLFFTKGASPELAETLAYVVLDHAVLMLPASDILERRASGWFEDWCLQMADRVQDNWNLQGKSTAGGEDLVQEPPSIVGNSPGEAAARVAFGFLTERDQSLISWALFDGIPFCEIARRLEVEEEQAFEEFVKARNRLVDLIDADREIPPHLRRTYTGQD